MTLFLRLLKTDIPAKGEALAAQIAGVNSGQPTPETFTVAPADFKQIPGSPFAYWVESLTRSLYSQLPSLEEESKRHIALGLSTKDDKRFVRVWWEIHPESIGHYSKWSPYANGSTYKPYYCDHATVVLRENDFYEIRQNALTKYPYLGNNADWIIHAENDYLSPGIGWPLRTHTFCPQVIPYGFVFSARTYALT